MTSLHSPVGRIHPGAPYPRRVPQQDTERGHRGMHRGHFPGWEPPAPRVGAVAGCAGPRARQEGSRAGRDAALRPAKEATFPARRSPRCDGATAPGLARSCRGLGGTSTSTGWGRGRDGFAACPTAPRGCFPLVRVPLGVRGAHGHPRNTPQPPTASSPWGHVPRAARSSDSLHPFPSSSWSLNSACKGERPKPPRWLLCIPRAEPAAPTEISCGREV